jgi:hypothetical protein
MYGTKILFLPSSFQKNIKITHCVSILGLAVIFMLEHVKKCLS